LCFDLITISPVVINRLFTESAWLWASIFMSMSAMEKPRAVVLLSGGMDSSVVLAIAADEGYEVHAITISYGQRHRVELESARKMAQAIGVKHHVFIDLDSTPFAGSALTSEEIEVPKGPRLQGADPIPPTYVPARNTVFLSLALAYAESMGARDIFIGVSSVDYSGYPDCRPQFLAAFEEAANLGTRSAVRGERFRIQAPLIEMTKGETVMAGIRLGVDFSLTHSCYDPGPAGEPCGQCEACLLRRRGFEAAGVEDPVADRKKAPSS
jgi:7-cyano-7-deazaguanine synthase